MKGKQRATRTVRSPVPESGDDDQDENDGLSDYSRRELQYVVVHHGLHITDGAALRQRSPGRDEGVYRTFSQAPGYATCRIVQRYTLERSRIRHRFKPDNG